MREVGLLRGFKVGAWVVEDTFAILTLTLDCQSTTGVSGRSPFSPRLVALVSFSGCESVRWIHQGSMGRTIPGGALTDGWSELLDGTAFVLDSFLKGGSPTWITLGRLKTTKPSGWMAAYIDRMARQRMTMKTRMRTKMANPRRHVCGEMW